MDSHHLGVYIILDLYYIYAPANSVEFVQKRKKTKEHDVIGLNKTFSLILYYRT